MPLRLRPLVVCCLCCLIAGSSVSWAQESHLDTPGEVPKYVRDPIPLYTTGLGPFHRPISSSNKEAQAFFDLGVQPLLDAGEKSGNEIRHVFFHEAAVIEIARKQQMHAIARENVNRLLGRQIHAIEVVDPAIRFVGGEEGGADLVVLHAKLVSGGGFAPSQGR